MIIKNQINPAAPKVSVWSVDRIGRLIVGVMNLVLLVAVLQISIYFIIQNNFRADYKITDISQGKTKGYNIKLNTNVTFLNKVKLRDALDDIPENSVLVIDGSESKFIDYDILEIISEFHNKAIDKGIEVLLKGIEKVNVTAVH